MNNHIHDGVLQGSVTFATVLLFALGWHLVSMHNSKNEVGKAMSVFL